MRSAHPAAPAAVNAASTLSFEEPQPWERAQGSTVVRTLKVSADARKVYAQQEQVLPTLQHDHTIDPAATEHLQDVGRRVRILRDNAKKPSKLEQKLSATRAPKRVIPSRFREPNDNDASDDGDDLDDDDGDATDAHIATMLMDQEWDTRTWNASKIHSAIETLYHEIELADDANRRALATTMLVRLLETHEDAVDYVEKTLPVLMNKAFRGLSKRTNRLHVFRVAQLLAVLAEWFAPTMASENATGKSVQCLLREVDICARIVQHHWRSVLFERRLKHSAPQRLNATARDSCEPNDANDDVSDLVRLRAMHLVKHAELRYQFQTLRDAIGASGLPASAVASYVTMLFHLTRRRSNDSSNPQSSNAVLASQRKVVASGVLVVLAALVRHHRHAPIDESPTDVAALAKAIVQEIAVSQGTDAIAAILTSTIVHRVIDDVVYRMQLQPTEETDAAITRSLALVAALASVTRDAKLELEAPSIDVRTTVDRSECAFRLRTLEAIARTHLATPRIVSVLFRVLQLDATTADRRVTLLQTLQLLASAFGFAHVLDALTRNGGRCLEVVLTQFSHADGAVVAAAVALFDGLTCHADARNGLTTAGAPQLLLRWCSVAIEHSTAPELHVLGLIGIALLACQTTSTSLTSTKLLASLATLTSRIDVFYSLLLEIALDAHVEAAALFLLHANAFPSLLSFVLQVQPSCMDSAFQNAHQRNVSCVALGRMLHHPLVAQRCFSEDLVVHLALSLQCNRLDDLERVHTSATALERRVHVMGSRDASNALRFLSCCPSPSVNATLRPSLTSSSVPALPQALICDVLLRLHALEDVVAAIQHPSDGGGFDALEHERLLAAIKLCGYVRPLPFGDAARTAFVQTPSVYATYATEKLLVLVDVVAPAILHVLRDKSASTALVDACCAALSRLACTNAACSRLLAQGCLSIALLHLPEIVLTTTSPSRTRRPQQQTSVVYDAPVDDHGLLDVPASLFTLVGKLCAVADGRAALMRAQVLPRILKRLQLCHSSSRNHDDDTYSDDNCKDAIAVVIQRLALVNAVEGNTSELFVHFHVLELLAQLARAQNISTLLRHQQHQHPHQHQRKQQQHARQWRLLDHALGAIAALSIDVLVCVPQIADLAIVSLVLPFVIRTSHDGADGAAAKRIEALQYHAMQIVRSVAAYPFGKYHALLERIDDDDAPSRRTEAQHSSRNKAGSTSEHMPPTRLLDRVKQVACSFTLELAHRASPALAFDRKSVGELARETLVFIRECDAQATDGTGTSRPPPLSIPSSAPSHAKEHAVSRRTSTRLAIQSPTSALDPTAHPSFPALPASPLGSRQRDSAARAAAATSNESTSLLLQPLSPPGRSHQLASVRSTPLLPSQQLSSSPQRTMSPLQNLIASPQTRGATLAASKSPLVPSSNVLSAADLMHTRPTAHKPDATSVDSTRNEPALYTFARPKKRNSHKSKRLSNDDDDVLASCLMLDPLFQSGSGSRSAANVAAHNNTDARHRKQRSDAVRDHDNAASDRPLKHSSSPQSYVYVQELDRLGHCVSVKARRAMPGDKYAQSLGHITMTHVQQQ